MEVWVLVPVTVIAGLWAYLIVRSLSRSRVRELEIRERIAMIEKGHVPAPETDPRGFERAFAKDVMKVMEYREQHGSYRHRRAGTTLIGVGLGLMMMIAFAGEDPQTGLGVGGFLVMIGLAFLINGLLERGAGPEQTPSKTAGSAAEPPKME
jgi:hypothetical protein